MTARFWCTCVADGLQLATALAMVGLLLLTGSASADAADGHLLEDLRRGGHVIYFRHAPTEWSQQDRVRSLDDCSSCDPLRMRQLSSEGRAMARELGAAIRQLKIPIGRILASEYCRTVETARLLGLGEVEVTRDVINARVADYVGGREALMRAARARLAAPPPTGTNTVIVAHGNVFLLAAGTRPGEAGAAIVRGDGRGGFSVVAMLNPEEWSSLVATGSRAAGSARP